MTELDQSKIREKLDRINNPEKYRNNLESLFWKATVGTPSTIRLYSYPHQDPEEPFIECWFHYGVGPVPIICPKKTAQKDCPVCQFCYTKLTKSKDTEDQKLYKKIRVTQRFYAPVVDRADAELKPKLWSFSKTVYKTLLEHLIDPDYKHYLDPMKGFDVNVTSEKKKDMLYPTTSIRFKPKEVPLAASDKEMKRILEQTPKASDLFKLLSIDEIKQKMNEAWASNGDQKDEPEVASNYLEPNEDLDVESAFKSAMSKEDIPF